MSTGEFKYISLGKKPDGTIVEFCISGSPGSYKISGPARHTHECDAKVNDPAGLLREIEIVWDQHVEHISGLGAVSLGYSEVRRRLHQQLDEV